MSKKKLNKNPPCEKHLEKPLCEKQLEKLSLEELIKLNNSANEHEKQLIQKPLYKKMLQKYTVERLIKLNDNIKVHEKVIEEFNTKNRMTSLERLIGTIVLIILPLLIKHLTS